MSAITDSPVPSSLAPGKIASPELRKAVATPRAQCTVLEQDDVRRAMLPHVVSSIKI